MKGISELVAMVLLIAITVGIGSVIGLWVSTFTQSASQTTSKQGELQVLCSNAAISVTNLKYCNNNISGIIVNNGRIPIGNITLQVVFNNASQITVPLNDSTGVYLALRPGQSGSFNQSVGSSAYNQIYFYTNCSGVTDLASFSDVVAC